jgi:hypothetical protein
MAWGPSTALAQEETKREIRAEEVAEEGEYGATGADEADQSVEAPAAMTEPEMTDEEMTEKELDEAMAAIEQAEKELEEAKRQMELMGRKVAPEPVPVPGTDVGLVQVDGRAKKLQWSLNDDGTLYMRMLMWLQVWTRAIQLNPGTEVQGDTNPWYGDVGLRRARLLWFGQIFPRTFILLHVGINNQTFRNARKPQVFFHDAWMEFQVSKNKAFYLGGGLIYWNGISRQTNASTITLMSLDAPIMNWPLIEREDQFARQLGIYAKGKLGLFDYRVAVTRPFTPFDVSLTGGTAAPPPEENIGNYRDTNAWAYSGYFMLQFLDEESNVLPYTVGTYIGAKKVFNLGFGGYLHPGGVQYGESEVDPDTGDVTILSSKARMLGIAGVDLFLDMPFGGDDGGAVTWYGVYQYQNFGPNNVRNVGIMNPGTGGTAFTQFGTSSSAGNAYPMIGTGNHLYSEFGFLIPGHVGEEIRFQPYVNWQGSAFEAFVDAPRESTVGFDRAWMHHFGLGINMFIHRHNAKVSIEYRNRPIFGEDGSVQNRKGNSFIMQWHIFI